MTRAAMLFGLFASAAMASVAADQPSTLLDESEYLNALLISPGRWGFGPFREQS